jgi:hypothetical protein
LESNTKRILLAKSSDLVLYFKIYFIPNIIISIFDFLTLPATPTERQLLSSQPGFLPTKQKRGRCWSSGMAKEIINKESQGQGTSSRMDEGIL